ncbi:large conductance mechanosensitive channel protein MscL [Paenibacillus sp. GCM10023248]|uniref:large conductance mechanosensitive channel protein MscL n=1 Tax=Bacillales TaxID=1385 RepID=UPI002378BB59|nr:MULTISPECIES: large conductance mechanosensitive channel protein MscL [Bacillales]MDD9272185.1 large conductance mechanosensitive channel protein MscL [Paenibacillus sp. MAHUQ-63]MDR6885355.1 large conductance mechanosensitive channel [Bacillus sp. 3255]
MLKEFKDFAFKGNMVDLAVGVIIGGAFGKVITSIVNDVIMPPIGLLLGRVNFNELFISLNGKHYNTLAEAAADKGAPVLKYGVFISTFLDFLIVSAVIFIVIRQLAKFRKKDEPKEKAPATKECPHCLSDIPAKATRCKFCTSELASAPSVSGSIQ